jgi:hypothetical protein
MPDEIIFQINVRKSDNQYHSSIDIHPKHNYREMRECAETAMRGLKYMLEQDDKGFGLTTTGEDLK